MKKIYSLILFAVVVTANINAQTAPAVTMAFEKFNTQDGIQAMYSKSKTITDPTNADITTIGSTWTGLNWDLFLVKRDKNGILIFSQQWGGSSNGDDFGVSLIEDDSAYTYTCGVTTDTIVKCLIQKWDPSGNLVWSKTYGNTSICVNAGATDICLDSSRNVFITGGIIRLATLCDVLVAKFSNSSGALSWQNIYDYNGFDDGGVKITTDNGRVYLAGGVQNGVNDYRYTTMAHNISNGSQVSLNVSSTSSTTKLNLVSDLKMDSSRNLYMTGATMNSDFDMYVVVYDTLLTSVWDDTYGGGSGDDISNSIDVDATGNVAITGHTTYNDKDMTTIFYDSTGARMWVKIDTLAGNNEGTCVKFNASRDIIVCGYDSTTAINNYDFVTKRLERATGDEKWNIHFDGMKHLGDRPSSLAIDFDGNIDVVGTTQTSATTFEYRSVQYREYDIITANDLHNEPPAGNYMYYENRGQLLGADSTHSQVMDERFYTNFTYPKLYFTNNSYSMVFAHIDTIPATQDTMQKIDVSFPGSVSMDNAKIYPMEEQPLYLNYFLSHCPDGITEIHGNNRLVIPDLYPGIDLEFYSNNAGFKYYFIIKPGAHATDIQEFYDGASSTVLNGSTHVLTVNSNIGSVSFQRPKAYNLSSVNAVIPLTDSIFDWDSVDVNTYGFDIGTYDNTKPLIIEVQERSAQSVNATFQNIIWSTYVGGGSDDQFNKVVTKQNGVFVAGSSTSIDFPTLAGMTMSNNLGAPMATATKFNKAGVLMHSTYYGNANGNVQIHYVKGAVDSKKCFYLSGVAYKAGGTDNIPFPSIPLAGAYVDDTSFIANNRAVFIARFDSTFTSLNWVTSYGGPACGNSYPEYPEININNADNVYLTFNGDSTSQLQYEPGGYYNNMSAGSTIVKFDNTFQRKWATRFGSLSQNSVLKCSAFDPTGNFYVGGAVSSPMTGFPFVTPTGGLAYRDTIESNTDIAIAKFDKTTDSLLWSTIYGNNGTEQALGIAFDDGGSLYMTGNVHGGSDFPCHFEGTAGSYIDSTFNPGGDFYDAWMVKFGPSLDLKWASLWGENDGDAGYGVACDPITRDVFFTGITKSSDDSLWGNASYYSQGHGGFWDAYILAFSTHLVPKFATYLGYPGEDQGLSIAANTHNQLFMVGTTNSHQTSHFLNVNPGFGAWFVDTLTGGFDAHITSFIIDTANHTGIAEHIIYSDGLTIYPNPTNGNFNYVLKTDDKNAQLKVYNILGELVLLNKLSSGTGMYKGTIDLTENTNGIYFVIAEASNKLITMKVIKQ